MSLHYALHGPRLAVVVLATTVLMLLGGSIGWARADETVYACGPYPNNVFSPASSSASLQAFQQCGQAGTTEHMNLLAEASASSGQRAFWAAYAPAGLQIDEAQILSLQNDGVNSPSGGTYGGGFFWGPGGADGTTVVPAFSSAGPFDASAGDGGFPSGDFAFQIVCGASACDPGASLAVGQVDLSVGETQGPSISAGGLWNHSGWVWGSWPISVGGDSPSGVCGYNASISNDPVSASASYGLNQTVWHQCSSGGLSGALDTAQAPNGADTLSVSDSDAAGLGNANSESLDVDNQTPSVSLSGPSSASSTAGTQEISVSVGTGPSGAYGAECSVDGGPSSFYAGASSQVPVEGVGQHTVTCTGYSNAVSASGSHASSASQSFGVDIQQPTEAAISFANIKDALRCHVEKRRVLVRGRRYVIRRGGHRIVVYSRTHRVRERVRKCVARTVRRRVLVEIKRHGKPVFRHGKIVRVRRLERVVLLPHDVYHSTRRVGFDRSTTVSGLLLSNGVALAGQPVTIYAAPATGNGLQFTAISSATTDSYGVWVAKIPAGPSRLLEAVYGGTSIQGATTSTSVKVIVAARLRITSHTHRVAWGGKVVFSGHVAGGDIPPGGINLQLRYGVGRAWTTYGVKTHVAGNGDFRTSFTFGPGDPRDHIHFRFQFATLPGGGYPWAVGRSNIVAVVVGGHPPVARHHHRSHHRGTSHHRHQSIKHHRGRRAGHKRGHHRKTTEHRPGRRRVGHGGRKPRHHHRAHRAARHRHGEPHHVHHNHRHHGRHRHHRGKR